MSVRIIPRLDIKDPDLVKGIHLKELRLLGKPERFAHHYYEAGADELFYMDAVASPYARNTLADSIRRAAQNISIPLTVGGRLRSVDDIGDALLTGADNAAVNTAAIERPELISEAAIRHLVALGLFNREPQACVPARQSHASGLRLNRASINRYELRYKKFGSSTIVVLFAAIQLSNGSYMAYTDCSRNETGLDAYEWSLRV